LANVHLQGVDGPADRHRAPGDGEIKWTDVFRALDECVGPSVSRPNCGGRRIFRKASAFPYGSDWPPEAKRARPCFGVAVPAGRFRAAAGPSSAEAAHREREAEGGAPRQGG